MKAVRRVLLLIVAVGALVGGVGLSAVGAEPLGEPVACDEDQLGLGLGTGGEGNTTSLTCIDRP